MKTRESVIKKALAQDMEWDEALRVIKGLPKPWTTQDWKDRRSALIDIKCSICPATKDQGAIMVMQHTWQPTPWRFLAAKHREMIFSQWAEAHPFLSQAKLEDFKYEYEIRPLCPLCSGGTHRWKDSKAKTKKCTSVKNKVMCGHEFHESELVQGKLSQRTYDQQLATFISQTDYPLQTVWRDQFWLENSREVGKAATMEAFAQSLRYMELRVSDVKTCCRSCAAREDYRYISANNLEKILDEEGWDI